VADSLEQLAGDLEQLEPGDFEGLTTILSAIVKANKQVLFEGNGYSPEWHAEAARRGLPNNRTTVDALPALTTPKAKEVFARFGVLSERELASRVDINWERYVKVQNIEASCAIDIASTMILPATARYLGQLGGASASRGISAVCERVAGLADSLVDAIEALRHAQHAAHEATSVPEEAAAFANSVIPAQEALRAVVDELETLVADDLWPLPKYRELLFQY
jgi:glutamine synthetase